MAKGFAAFAFALGVSGCGGDFEACGDAETNGTGTAPRVENFRLANQLDGDTATLVFGARFTDTDGNLQGGLAEFHLNEETEPAVSFPLADVFRQSALPQDATEGELALTLRLVQDVADGSDLQVGLRLIDETGQPSNCGAVEVEFSVSRAATSLERQATEWLAGLWPVRRSDG